MASTFTFPGYFARQHVPARLQQLSLQTDPSLCHWIPPRHLNLGTTVTLLSEAQARPRRLTSGKRNILAFAKEGVVSSSSGSSSQTKEGDREPSDAALLRALQELQDSFTSAGSDFFAKLPSDLKVDLEDAAFALSNGPVRQECGDAAGSALADLALALESLSTTSAYKAVGALIQGCPSESTPRAAIARRLLSTSRHFSAMGAYGDGKAARIASSLKLASTAMAAASGYAPPPPPPPPASRSFQLGPLTVDVTPGKAFTGAAISAAFSLLCWQLVASFAAIPEGSLEYANDNALALALSLRGSLLALGYSCATIASVSFVGLIGLGLQLQSSTSKKEF